MTSPANMNAVYSPPAGLFPPPANFPDPQVTIFVGDGYSAAKAPQLEQFNILGVLNVAYDLDDQPLDDEYPQGLAPDPFRPAPVPVSAAAAPLQRYRQQFAKVGLIDGYGNLAQNMSILAAVYMADQLFTFPPGKPCPALVNQYERGNLLIHCWSGRSRSVTVAALYIWYKFGVQLGDPKLTSFAQVYDQVKTARGDSTSPVSPGAACVPKDPTGLTETPPTCGMQQAALEITSTYKALFPSITLA